MAFDADLSVAGAAVLLRVALDYAPAPESRISEWVDEGHVILNAATRSPREGPVSFEGVEYIREPLDRLHPDDPAERVTVRGGAQSAKSLIGQLWVCWSIANHPRSFAIGLPTGGEVIKYNDYKLQPLLDASPLLKPKVRPVGIKGSEGSNARKKRLYTGADILLFNLGSPAELQMISSGNMILEEVANAPKEVGSRGAPIPQARARQDAYSVVGSKELMVSTPGEQGECVVTDAEEKGTRSRYYGRCVHCLGSFRFEPEGLVTGVGMTPHFVCPGCGGVIEDRDRAFWRGDGYRWVPDFRSEDPEANPQPPAFIENEEELARWRARDVEGRQPSYYVWQAMCGLISLDKIALSIMEAKKPAELMTLEQQTFGRAYDPAVETVDWEELHKLREGYDQAVVPDGAELLTGFCDVQGSWLQWGVIAWGPGGEWWVVDRGIISGDTSSTEPWLELDEVIRRTYPHAGGGELEIEAFGVDTGYRTAKVYNFCRGRSTVYAMDGRPGWKIPIVGKAKVVKIVENGRIKGRVKLWPTGTWELKSLLAWSLKLSIDAGYQVRVQGRGHWSLAEDETWARQITAEGLSEKKDAKTGDIKRWWAVLAGDGRNEETDIWVGARALAWSLGVGAARRDGRPGERIDWESRAQARGQAPPDLFNAAVPSSTGPSAATKTPTPGASTPEPDKPVAPRRFFPKR
ncbi:MAG: phage terminase large subunit family protein [Caulobacter sp.]|nr:phage terminase large subunit family protein [Caulobacter sp.]